MDGLIVISAITISVQLALGMGRSKQPSGPCCLCCRLRLPDFPTQKLSVTEWLQAGINMCGFLNKLCIDTQVKPCHV